MLLHLVVLLYLRMFFLSRYFSYYFHCGCSHVSYQLLYCEGGVLVSRLCSYYYFIFTFLPFLCSFTLDSKATFEVCFSYALFWFLYCHCVLHLSNYKFSPPVLHFINHFLLHFYPVDLSLLAVFFLGFLYQFQKCL